MARSSDTVVDPAILVWARSTAGLSIEEAAARLQTKSERVQDWEHGEGAPSMAQLRRMAGIYKRLLSDFFVATVPDEEPLPHDFRRLPGDVAGRYSRALRVQLRLAGERRQLALDLSADLDAGLPKLSGRLSMESDPETAGGELRRLLGVAMPDQRTWRDPRVSYNGWRAAAERAGILVFQAAGIAPAEMLGFALPSRPLPVIGVNRKLRPNGRTFTLLHECVHVFLEQSSLCDIEEGFLRPPAEQRVEVFCNAVAGAALVPFDVLLAEPLVRPHPPRPRDWSSDELGSLGRAFGVSDEVILRRLLMAGRTSAGFYAAWRQARGGLSGDVAEADPEAEFKRNMPQEVVSDLGRPFTRLILESYFNSFTSLSDVSRYLGAQGRAGATGPRAGGGPLMPGYCIGTSSILEWYVRRYPPDILPGLPARMEELIAAGRLRAPKIVFDEIKPGDDVHAWAKGQDELFIEESVDVQLVVRELMARHHRGHCKKVRCVHAKDDRTGGFQPFGSRSAPASAK